MQERTVVFGVLILAALAILMIVPESQASFQPGEEGGICLGCHSSKDLSMTLGNGQQMSVYVDSSLLKGSVHKELSCSGCHKGFSAGDHPQRKFKDRRAHAVASSGVCKQCHEFKKGIHLSMLNTLKDVLCVDCHGYHGVKVVEEGVESCNGCHKYSLSITYKDGSKQSLMIDLKALEGSVHSKLSCIDCHFGFSTREHPERGFANARDFTIVSTEICRRCHFDKYTKTLEGTHFNVLSKGNTKAPVCVDCHGAHSIETGRKEKLRSAHKCEKCHPDIYKIYSMSVHGKALLSDHNQDVPVCSDCHRAHDISAVHMTDFRNNVPQMCGNCHANEGLMKKYGLTTAVLQSYLDDFHGVTLTYYKKQEGPLRQIAVCIDCHGIHDITKTKGPDSSMVKAKLQERCRKCHPGANENFPGSWISHYEPNFKRAPLVYAINLIYSVFIPFMIVGLVLQIILHIWRYAVNR